MRITFEDINGEFSKAEIRMLYLWKEDSETPQLMDNLVRMTKAEMVNVNFNKKMPFGLEVLLLFENNFNLQITILIYNLI